MEKSGNNGFSLYRPGNLIRKNNSVVIAWPADLCIPENLAQVTPLDVDEYVLKHLGFVVTEHAIPGTTTYKRKVNWQQNAGEDSRQLEFFVLFRDESILMGLKHPMAPVDPMELTPVRFAHDLQNYYATVTGIDELNILLVNARKTPGSPTS